MVSPLVLVLVLVLYVSVSISLFTQPDQYKIWKEHGNVQQLTYVTDTKVEMIILENMQRECIFPSSFLVPIYSSRVKCEMNSEMCTPLNMACSLLPANYQVSPCCCSFIRL